MSKAVTPEDIDAFIELAFSRKLSVIFPKSKLHLLPEKYLADVLYVDLDMLPDWALDEKNLPCVYVLDIPRFDARFDALSHDPKDWNRKNSYLLTELAYDWPGNVRQLRNLMDWLMNHCICL